MLKLARFVCIKRKQKKCRREKQENRKEETYVKFKIVKEKTGTNDLVEQENRRDERKQDDECRTLDPSLIEKLKSELCVPLQKTRYLKGL